ncbi:antitoxin VbhA family protein [Bifidobacterium avesanii]|nr:antitoxin VbhA family protein [Bifidobacterium avesanii]
MEEAIHSGEMEGAYVSEEFRRDAELYVNGDIGIEELGNRTMRRWNIDKPEESKDAHDRSASLSPQDAKIGKP